METEITLDYLKEHNFNIYSDPKWGTTATKRYVGGTITFGICTSPGNCNGFKDINFCEICTENDVDSWYYKDGGYFRGYLKNLDQAMLILQGMGFDGPNIFNFSKEENKEYEKLVEIHKSNEIIKPSLSKISTQIAQRLLDELDMLRVVDIPFYVSPSCLVLYYNETTKLHLIVINISSRIEINSNSNLDIKLSKVQDDLNAYFKDYEKSLKIQYEDHSLLIIFDTQIDKNYLDKFTYICTGREKERD